MALLVKVPAAKANDLSSIPGTQMVEAENQLSLLFFDLHMYVVCVLGFLLLLVEHHDQNKLGEQRVHFSYASILQSITEGR